MKVSNLSLKKVKGYHKRETLEGQVALKSRKKKLLCVRLNSLKSQI
ncbi:hypothetical protein Patl1_26542 [Pistacia atlantica]|uniref:Uncharacterized protein n=1 Tax=Pistacia atlantica TaxID=434234 RepID=A0ACC1B0G7_9ROSI|nr:hypothetical protein Patl1_26542 [Pistacia atlantica]